MSVAEDNRSRTPNSNSFVEYMGSNWAGDSAPLPAASQVAPFAATRRAAVAERFAGHAVVIEAGAPKVRSNDTEYRYRPHAAFAHLTGWGTATVPDSVLVIDARAAKSGSAASAILFLRPTAGKGNPEFFANSMIGEFWVGQRPSLAAVSALLGLETRNLAQLPEFLASMRAEEQLTLDDPSVLEFTAELRLIKDSYEISEMRNAVAASVAGFENIARELPKAIGHSRGERLVETAFFAKARELGHDLGYDTISAAGAHACTLHWVVNDGPVLDGQLILVDAGVEVDSFYTADVTRTMPVNGKFTPLQRKVYEAVLEAADAVFAMAKPGVTYSLMHDTAMAVIAKKVHEWGLLPEGVSVEDSLHPDNQWHRRWMVHGTGHHLGIDVHDCAAARRSQYKDAVLEPGMIFTIEPGLYFHPDDLLVPEELRGIGVRIEDDVLVTETGVENLSAALPRRVEDIEAWMAKHRS
jgi:Xaa-Pro aminopeptidase